MVLINAPDQPSRRKPEGAAVLPIPSAPKGFRARAIDAVSPLM